MRTKIKQTFSKKRRKDQPKVDQSQPNVQAIYEKGLGDDNKSDIRAHKAEELLKRNKA